MKIIGNRFETFKSALFCWVNSKMRKRPIKIVVQTAGVTIFKRA